MACVTVYVDHLVRALYAGTCAATCSLESCVSFQASYTLNVKSRGSISLNRARSAHPLRLPPLQAVVLVASHDAFRCGLC